MARLVFSSYCGQFIGSVKSLVGQNPDSMWPRLLLTCLLACLAQGASAADRFKLIIDNAPESAVNATGQPVDPKRQLIQKELMAQRPSLAELGVRLPTGSKLKPEESARQIVQHDPAWRVYEYRVSMPRGELLRFFQAQGLRHDRPAGQLRFPNGEDFVDGFEGNPVKGFRVWRKPS
jgi:hypothetical protein